MCNSGIEECSWYPLALFQGLKFVGHCVKQETGAYNGAYNGAVPQKSCSTLHTLLGTFHFSASALLWTLFATL